MSNKISIDIGSKNIHIAEGDFQKGALTVKDSYSFEMPPGCIITENVEDSKLLSESLMSYLTASEFKSKDATLSINATHAIIRELDFPKAKPKELYNMILNEMYQTFHVLNSDVIQYKFIGQATDGDGITLDRYRVAAIDHEIIDQYHSALERSGLKASSMDLNVNAIDKLLQWVDSINEKSIDDKTVMLIDFGHSVTTVYICSKNQPMFFRNLSMGSSEIDNALKNTFYMEDADAVNYKKRANFFENSAEVMPYFESIKPFLYHLNDEIRKLTAFYTNRSRESVSRCYIFGQGAEMAGIEKYWESTMNIPVEIIKSVSRANVSATIKNPAHVNAVAALIRYQE